jgi:putative ABC transport system permease protein
MVEIDVTESRRMILTDAKIAIRTLWRIPAFSLISILTLALGIGACTAVFVVTKSVLLTSLRYPDSEKIVALETLSQRNGGPYPRLSSGDLTDIRSAVDSFALLSPYSGGEMGVQTQGHAVFAAAIFINSDFPRIFGIPPLEGHLFDDEEADQSCLVSRSFAERNYGDVRSAVGKTLRLDETAYLIVAVMPDAFAFPDNTDLWIGTPKNPVRVERTKLNFYAVAKLRKDRSLATAQAQLENLGRQLGTAFPDSNRGRRFGVRSLEDQLVGHEAPLFLVLAAAVSMLLLIACVNVAHLQLARAAGRLREVAVRTALGASRSVILWQIVLESLVLSLVGSALGVLLSYPLVKSFVDFAPATLPRLNEVRLNWSVLAISCGLCILTTLLSSVGPCLYVYRADLYSLIRQDSSRGMTGRRQSRIREGLVIAEVGITFVLLVSGGLLAHTIANLASSELGYMKERLLVMYAHAPASSLEDYTSKTREFESAYLQLRTVPGVEGVAGVMGLPTGRYNIGGSYSLETEGGSVPTVEMSRANFVLVSQDYFRVLGIPLMKGRIFMPEDVYNTTSVAIISESLARRSFPNVDAIGKRLRCTLDDPNKYMTVVGVVGDVRRQSPASEPEPTLYLPLQQHPYFANEIQVVLRTKVDPLTLAGAVRDKIESLDPEIAIDFTTLDRMVGESVALPKFRAFLINGLAVLGLLLAAVGIYGILTYSVAQRTFEIGIRMSVGAVPRDILRLMLARTLVIVVPGLLLGLLLSFPVIRLMESMLVKVPPYDPASFLGTGLILVLTALFATLIPAMRAARVDPVAALRAE